MDLDAACDWEGWIELWGRREGAWPERARALWLVENLENLPPCVLDFPPKCTVHRNARFLPYQTTNFKDL
jgi:hypothetical protein